MSKRPPFIAENTSNVCLHCGGFCCSIVMLTHNKKQLREIGKQNGADGDHPAWAADVRQTLKLFTRLPRYDEKAGRDGVAVTKYAYRCSAYQGSAKRINGKNRVGRCTSYHNRPFVCRKFICLMARQGKIPASREDLQRHIAEVRRISP